MGIGLQRKENSLIKPSRSPGQERLLFPKRWGHNMLKYMVRLDYKGHRLPGFWDLLNFLSSSEWSDVDEYHSAVARPVVFTEAHLPLRIIHSSKSDVLSSLQVRFKEPECVCIWKDSWREVRLKIANFTYILLLQPWQWRLQPRLCIPGKGPSLRLSNYPLVMGRLFWLCRNVMLEKCVGIAGGRDVCDNVSYTR